ncbi:MAG: hypothetical protein UT63_C0019G0010 [Candidatus Gottesmanbacteria bacterium GW2011_GWC2_39_8]|uniref:PIN domain-containing protein n=1 Tax=Candidatus Gottesmanbacteria bacterium GW2011_GWC2_39_8 TaxID=1618450 RepID=A0A0G0PZH2_9BACT|nr:MAG: hypothetical protein UT63_C0019G0010 [Candidatus Gottesmanbacteria bacterium GW2011_GWC2_39_8]
MITVTEIFIHEEKIGDPFTLQIYEHTFKSLPNLSLIPIDWNIARFASKLRAKYGFLKTPGALQLSSSIIKGCRGFITNDEKLKKVKEIEVVVLKEFV